MLKVPRPWNDRIVARSDPRASAPAEPWVPRRLTRASRDRVLAGVGRGLADHLGLEVLWVRLALVVLVACYGAGVLLYAALWIFAPLGVDHAEEPDEPESPARESGYLAALFAVGAGILLLLQRVGFGLPAPVIWPLFAVGVGIVILWRQADDAQRSRWRRAGSTRRASLLRTIAGGAFVVTGLIIFVATRVNTAGVARLLLAVLVVVVGIGLISGPWWVRMGRDLRDERAARIREQERAEIAAHVHDSVLHTLTLIQRHVDDPREVAKLARAQERELRTWLYRPVVDPDTVLAGALARVAAEVEDAHGIGVDVVVVGDCPLDDRLRAMLQAAREALVNAAKYADGAPVSLFAEVEPDGVTVFVRDRGPGFVLADVPSDRLGVRQSIVGRMQRNGGTAVLRTAPGDGTEVELCMPAGSRGGTP